MTLKIRFLTVKTGKNDQDQLKGEEDGTDSFEVIEPKFKGKTDRMRKKKKAW